MIDIDMKKVVLFLVFFVFQTSHLISQESQEKKTFISKLDLGLGVSTELNVIDDWISVDFLQYSIQANINYEFSKKFKLRLLSEYGLDNDNFIKHNLNIAWMFVPISKSSTLGIY